MQRAGLPAKPRNDAALVRDHAVVSRQAIDETPVGVFVEIEGSEDAIHSIATELGKTSADYITDSYRFLFLQHRDANGLDGHHMVFAGRVDE